ncbi:MAG: hypothetical protein JGK01_17500 [Microcoleus sp. PH2017_03_ELD_O_A]|nr:hypothetical protein [Microcoleus sp. PH2017_03_ELD_O_A]
MKKLLTDWGFTRQGWSNNSRGEYLVFLQLVLLAAFTILPVYQLPGFKIQSTQLIYLTWFLASILSSIGLTFIIKGLIDLGKNLTPIFFDIKSRREETWLSDKYPDYSEYRQRVKKLIPGIY